MSPRFSLPLWPRIFPLLLGLVLLLSLLTLALRFFAQKGGSDSKPLDAREHYLFILQGGLAQPLALPDVALREIEEGEETEIGRKTIRRFLQEKTEFASFMKGKKLGAIRFTGKKESLGCGPDVFAVEGDTDEGALAASFDLNPGDRFELTSLDPVGESELLNILVRRLASHDQEGARPLGKYLGPLAKKLSATPEVAVHALQDRRRGERYAVVTVDRQWGQPSRRATLQAIFASRPGEEGRELWLKTDEGCEDCDDMPTTSQWINFGDLSGDGHLSFVFSQSAYESWGYEILKWDGERMHQSSAGGGGC